MLLVTNRKEKSFLFLFEYYEEKIYKTFRDSAYYIRYNECMVFITGADWTIITFVICLILSFITLITIDFDK